MIHFSFIVCTSLQVKGEEIIWSGIDYALEPPVRRVLKAVFSSIQAAQEMFSFYEDVSKVQ